jgi:hypothetical protein
VLFFLAYQQGSTGAGEERAANRRGETGIRISDSARAVKNSPGTKRSQGKRSEARVPYQEGGIRSRGREDLGSSGAQQQQQQSSESGDARCAGRQGRGSDAEAEAETEAGRGESPSSPR